MKTLLKTSVVVASVVVLGYMGTARAATATAYVGTVLGANAFEVRDGGSELYFYPQPDTDYVWMENNGSAPGTIATSGGYNRDGMRTFACTDIAYGQRLDSIRMTFEYYTGADPITEIGIGTNGYPTINIFITDGNGHYAIWSATSGGTAFTTTSIGNDWSRLDLDCTNLTNSTWGKAFEYNGGLTTDRPSWDTIKGWTIAGFYDYQRTPEGGFEAWNQTLWSDITNVGTDDTTLNQYGIALIWGDTVGGMNGDGCGEIGSEAERIYAKTGRLIRNYQVTVGQTVYDMSFAPGIVPEPATVGLLALGGLGFLRRRNHA